MSSEVQATAFVDLEQDEEFKTTPRQRLQNAVRKAHRERYWDEHDKESYVCPMCDQEKYHYEVHHIDGDWLNGHDLNLVGICYTCHKRRHGLPQTMAAIDEWKAEYEALTGGEE